MTPMAQEWIDSQITPPVKDTVGLPIWATISKDGFQIVELVVYEEGIGWSITDDHRGELVRCEVVGEITHWMPQHRPLYPAHGVQRKFIMNVQEAVKQTLDIYKDEDEYQSIDNAMDYLLQLLKINDQDRIKKAVYKDKHPITEINDPYMSGYRAGWNDALDEVKAKLKQRKF